MMAFVIKALRTLFFSLDKIIYGLIDEVYSLLMTISRTSVFSGDVIAEFSSRIYALAGIFMLFKVSLSVINYVINPDDFTDKQKGFASIGKRIMTSLVLLVITPYIFQEAYELQAIILEENTIMNLVFGTNSGRILPNEDYAKSAGRNIQFTVMYTFMQPNFDEFYSDSNYPMSSCMEPYVLDSNGFKMSRGDSNFIYALNESCFGTYNNDVYEDNGALSKAFKEYASDDIYQNYAQGVAQQNFNLMARLDLVLQKDNDDRYLINYRFGVSTAVGIAIVYLFLLFCIDIAARSVKLGFLQMVSPIPILSYIDPKSGKDGLFKKWYQMCFSTYVSLFLRLFALYVGIYAITVIEQYTDVVTGEAVNGGFLFHVFMIIGILIFAKQLPKIIEQLFGVKMDGKFTLNPLKKIEDEALGGKRLTGFAAGAAVGTVGALTGAGVGRGFGAAFGGLTSGKGWTDTLKTQRDKNATMRTARLDGSTFAGRMGTRFSNAIGSGGELAQIEREKHDLQDKIDAEKNAKEAIEAEIAPKQNQIKSNQTAADAIKAMQDRAVQKIKEGNGAQGAHYQSLIQQAEQAKADGNGTEAARKLQEAEKYLNTTGRDAWLDANLGTGNDAKLDDLQKLYENSISQARGTDAGGNQSTQTAKHTAAELDNQSKEINRNTTDTKVSISTQERQIQTHDEAIKQHSSQMQDISRREKIAKANQSAVK